MTYLGNPCPCGNSLTEHEDGSRVCESCGRRYEFRGGLWIQETPLSELREEDKKSKQEPCKIFDITKYQRK